ncbi:flagellar biosynthesis protein FlhB [Stappia sp. F7233]|uniref:Flagellar biosynthetic protein FlhB n=1 Tax=Stappia albiluteola TaxID=2758565 RepID=A0A839AJT2_9HYPH|nr:flagellar biosynthesis protein FlhB [Stappia albiluteola]MBA5779288.1 flagellar biosynthesis protein FlhB [Stappia albiluteola]
MAEESDDSEKTEDPSQKRLEDALKKGDVAKSQEVSAWFVLLGTGLVVGMLSSPTAIGVSDALRGYVERAHAIPMDAFAVRDLWRETGMKIGAALALPLIILLVMAVAGNLVQHRFVWSTERITPKLNKVSPLAGFKRLFSKESLVNFAKGLAKIVIVGSLMTLVLWPQRDTVDTMIFRETSVMLTETRDLVLKLIIAILSFMTVVAGLDYLYQRHRWFEKLKMTKQEVKEEYKQTEGDPQIKARIRQLRLERSRKRMMASVPDATVVVTNPTHFAVALKYEDGMQAPVCVAKGVDQVALKIREVAKANNVPVIENPPLARALHASIDIDESIPEEHYRAVAEVIGFVFRMRRRKSWQS